MELILFEQFIHMNVSKDFWDMFVVVIQFGSILAVALLYFHKLNPFSPSKSPIQKKRTWSLWGKVLVGIIPLGLIGLPFDDLVTGKLYGYVTVAIALIDRHLKSDTENSRRLNAFKPASRR